MKTIIYTGTPLPDVKKSKDVVLLNPVHFSGPVKDARAVFLNGSYPEVAFAYRQAGIEVRPLSKFSPPKAAGSPDGEAQKGA